MRWGFNSSATVQAVLEKVLISRHVFVFRGKRSDLLRCLYLVHRRKPWRVFERLHNLTPDFEEVGGRIARSQGTASTGLLDSYRLDRVEWPQGDSRTLSLYLKPVSKVMYCEQSGARCHQIHETTVRRVRDLPLFEYRVVLHVPRHRVWCERCGGPTLEKLDWPGRYQRVTEHGGRLLCDEPKKSPAKPGQSD